MSAETKPIDATSAARALDEQFCEIVRWHFSPETGTPHWLEWSKSAGWNPAEEVQSLADLNRFPHFDGELLRNQPHEVWIPKAYEGRPFTIFETGGTTGMPKQRINWEDYKRDYEDFSATLSDEAFPPGGYWLMIGPTGPRRLRLAIEHLANHRGSSCYFVDLDPRWVKKMIRAGDVAQAKAYMAHVMDQAVSILENRKVDALFTTPKLLEELSERISIADAGVKGVFCGGTTMTPQTTRFLVEEVLEDRVEFVPTYGNTLMGLAAHKPDLRADGYSITYYAPQPRAVLRVTNPDKPDESVDYDEWGRVELTTLTQEFFMPRFLERDEAERARPIPEYPWDGVENLRIFSRIKSSVAVGVY
jgi:phenylacetate-coenzyme A ligase PaaK-like adenylate-forming protein